MPGTLSIVSQDFSARAGSWVGSCSIVVNAPMLQGIQFSVREVGEPGSGTIIQIIQVAITANPGI